MLKHNKIVLLLSGLGVVGNAYAIDPPPEPHTRNI